jgi:ligand-binding sensor domain-containing protein
LKDDLARSFAEDRAGNIWIGFNTGLARYRNGAFTFFTTKDGLSPGSINYIYTDHAGGSVCSFAAGCSALTIRYRATGVHELYDRRRVVE